MFPKATPERPQEGPKSFRKVSLDGMSMLADPLAKNVAPAGETSVGLELLSFAQGIFGSGPFCSVIPMTVDTPGCRIKSRPSRSCHRNWAVRLQRNSFKQKLKPGKKAKTNAEIYNVLRRRVDPHADRSQRLRETCEEALAICWTRPPPEASSSSVGISRSNVFLLSFVIASCSRALLHSWS